MAISFANALGIHEKAVVVRANRAEVLANNIANADTPNFKARDLDFKAMLAGEREALQPVKLAATQAGHSDQLLEPDLAADMMFRMPTQPSVDGNTVDLQQEMARYTENGLDYQASFDFLNRKFQGLSKALKGQ